MEEILPYEDYGKCTIIAARITAKVRNKMIREGIRPYNALYGDTDSTAIFFDREFDPALMHPKRLGAWSHETYNPLYGDFMTIHGAKDYETRSVTPEGLIIDKRTHKGVPKDAEEIKPNLFVFRKVLKPREAIVMKKSPYIYVISHKRRLKWA